MFTPHTNTDIQQMLEELEIDSIDQLFDEIPSSLKIEGLDLPDPLPEMELTRIISERAAKDQGKKCFIGAGAYEHFIPAAVWQITSRGEYLTSYTPYQAEASQGSLQTFYEYQTMMARLMAMDVSNASQYDGASSLAESVLMACRCNRKSKSMRILMPEAIHPAYRKTVEAITSPQKIKLESVPFTKEGGQIDFAKLKEFEGEDITAIVVPQPNFFGILEEVDELTDWAHAQGAIVIGVVNPMAMSLIKPPGEWGQNGADIACGEGQPIGSPLSSGGPYFGFMCCREKFIRNLPGRLIGRTTDENGKTGFTLTLQAREQHIRRAKATSNICTNQGLLVTAATIFMSLLGSEGMRRVALKSHQNAQDLLNKLLVLPGVELVFNGPFFHEFVLRLPCPVHEVEEEMNKLNILPGLSLKHIYPEIGDCILVCVTETKSEFDIQQYVEEFSKALQGEMVC